MVAVARRYWWVSSLVLLLVALVAGARYVTAPRTYIATQDLTVALIHAQALGDPGDAALATSGALAVAHALARPEVITSSALADAVLARVPADTARREGIDRGAIQQALSATDQLTQVRLQAAWPTEPGARAILTAAALALQANPPVPSYALTPGDSVAVQAAPTGVVVTQDAQRRSGDLGAVIQQLAIGLAIALLLPWVIVGLSRARAPRSPATSPAS